MSFTDPVDEAGAGGERAADPCAGLAGFRAAQQEFHTRYAGRSKASCRRGCAACCSQMVYDVAAVEIEALGNHLRRSGRLDEVRARLELRRAAYDRTRLAHPRRTGESDDDWTERVALAFWARGLPCALLDADGACSVYEYRPQSCRRFFVHGPPELCAPGTASDPHRRARMVEPGAGGEVDALLQRLSLRVPFDPEDDRLDHALLRWIQFRSTD